MTEAFTVDDSLVTRYSSALRGIPDFLLRQSSLREGASIRGPLEHNGVHLYLLDLSSYSATGTFKAAAACVTMAKCLANNERLFVTQSSGNTGNALAAYAAHTGIRVIILYPELSRYKIDPTLMSAEQVFVAEIAGPESRLKSATKDIASLAGVRWLPDYDLQIQANKVRAYFVQDYCEQSGVRFDWHVQALSSAYGIFGFFTGIDELALAGRHAPYPKFLGIQQEAVAPYYRAVMGGDTDSYSSVMLEPTLFRSRPDESMLVTMRSIVTQSKGAIAVVTNDSFLAVRERALTLLASFGITLGRVSQHGHTVTCEQAGIYAMVGTLNAVDSGMIRPGESILVCLTGGVSPDRESIFTPPHTIGTDEGIEVIAPALQSFVDRSVSSAP